MTSAPTKEAKSQERPIVQSGLVLNGVTVVDTRTGKLTPSVDLIVDAGKILRIVPAGSVSVLGTGRLVEANGKFVVPGFLDMHVHNLQEEHPQDSLALMLSLGITGVRQMVGSPELLRARKEGRLDLGPDAPEVLAVPGQILTRSNAATPEAAVLEVKKQKAEGADFIKTIDLTPQAFFAALEEAKRQGLPYAGHLSMGVDPAKASKRGMRAIEHLGPATMTLIYCSKREWLVRIILAVKPPKPLDMPPEKMATDGKLAIMNPILLLLEREPNILTRVQLLLDSFSEEKARKLAEVFAANETWHVPTLIRSATMQLGDDPLFTNDPNLRFVPKSILSDWTMLGRRFAQKVSAKGKKTLRQLTDIDLRLTKIFDDAGVKMLAGSDYSGVWQVSGYCLHQEFDLLAQAGLSPLKVLQMTTLNGAEFLGRQATLGTVEEGKDANLVLLEGNPIESVGNLHRIASVVREGEYYSQDRLEAIRNRVTAHAPYC